MATNYERQSRAGHLEAAYWDEISEGSNRRLREELETAWLRGRTQGIWHAESGYPAANPGQEAADYAERVVGGSSRPERPEVG